MEDPYNSTENACDAPQKQGKQSAKKIDIPIPDGMGDVITGAILAIPTGIGSIVSSFHLGNRR